MTTIGLIYPAGFDATGYPKSLPIPDDLLASGVPHLTSVEWERGPGDAVMLTVGRWELYSSEDSTPLPSGAAGPGSEWVATISSVG